MHSLGFGWNGIFKNSRHLQDASGYLAIWTKPDLRHLASVTHKTGSGIFGTGNAILHRERHIVDGISGTACRVLLHRKAACSAPGEFPPSLASNLRDARSLAIHPASTTHSQLTAEDQLKTGVTPGYVRLSVGIEHIDDILADLERGLAATEGFKAAAE